MSASAKLDMSSGSPDKSLYTPRVSSMSAPLDRSGSFRENSASLRKENVKNFLDSLSFDPKSVSVNYKFSGQVKFKRLISGTLGLQVDDSATNISNNKLLPSAPPSPSPENLKRLKNGLRESSTKARERLKTFNGAMSVMNKCFPVIPSRKRSRLDVSSSERATVSLSSERSVVGSSSGKTGTQTHTITSGFEPELQLSEEKGKITGPIKRTRTSMVDSRTEIRGGTPARSSGNMDREVLRPPSTNSVNGELSVGVDNWVKPKMKKKRSGIKSDVSLSSVATKTTEAKQGMQPRHLVDARLRLNDSHAFRSGVPSVSGGVEQADSPLQSTSSGHDRRDRSGSIEKERLNIGAVNRTSSKEDLNSPSPTSNTKPRAPPRASRSGLKVLQKLSPIVQGTTVSSEWELSHSKSRKHALPTQSSSPPVTKWGSQRPEKLSRIAKRTNFVPISNDESPVLDGTSDFTGNETGSSSKIRMSTNSPQQFKIKGDQFSSPALSESEVDERESPRIQKVSNFPPRKNKIFHEGSDNGDGIHNKPGRSGRGSTSTRTLIPITDEKAGDLGTTKQLRSARTGLEKTESKVGRPPSRKLSDRKPFTKQKQTTISAAAYFHDDGKEELLAAAAAVIDPALCFSSPFWRQMEPYFCYISDPDLAYLKQQGNSVHPILYTCTTKADRERNHMECPFLSTDVAVPTSDVPLSQRVLSALITEEDCDEFSDDELEFDVDQIKFDLQKLENGYELRANGSSINDVDHILLDTNMVLEKELISDLEILENDFISVQAMEIDNDSSEFEYSNMSIDEKIVVELESVGISVQLPDLTQTGDEAIKEIGRLKDKHLGQVSTAKEVFVDKLFSSASKTRDVQEKEFEHHALNKLLAIAYEKYMASWGPTTSGVKNTSNKMAKQAALAFIKRTLERCHQFENTGKSCFGNEFFRNIFISGSARLRDTPLSDAATGTYRSSIVDNHSINHSSEQFIGKDDSLLTNEVVGTIGTPSGFVGSLSSNAKGKRSDRDREEKGSREVKVGQPTGNVKGERKNKTKPKQKITQSPASGLVNNSLEQPETISRPGSSEMIKRGNVQEDDFLEDPIDLSHLQLPGMDDIDGQGQDFGSWLNIDDELPDQDGFDGLEGLEIPMDDLADLNFKF